jgi:hypothetical protein
MIKSGDITIEQLEISCHYDALLTGFHKSGVQRSGICAVGGFISSLPPATAAEQRTKVEILFKS